jgi:hypothetical protein
MIEQVSQYSSPRLSIPTSENFTIHLRRNLLSLEKALTFVPTENKDKYFRKKAKFSWFTPESLFSLIAIE